MGVHTSFGISSAKRFPAPGKFVRSAPWQLVAPALGRSSVWLSARSCLLSLALDYFRILRQTSLTSPLQCLATPALGAQLRRSFIVVLGQSITVAL